MHVFLKSSNSEMMQNLQRCSVPFKERTVLRRHISGLREVKNSLLPISNKTYLTRRSSQLQAMQPEGILKVVARWPSLASQHPALLSYGTWHLILRYNSLFTHLYIPVNRNHPLYGKPQCLTFIIVPSVASTVIHIKHSITMCE